MRAFLKNTILAGVAGFTAIAGVPAQAQNFDDGPVVTGERQDKVTVVVPYSDLNLGSENGVARLQSRVKYAARKICYSDGRLPLAVIAKERECYVDAMAGAEPQIADAISNYGTRVAIRSGGIAVSRPARSAAAK